jgi:hypothetical protein
VTNEGGKLYLTSKEEICEATVERSTILQDLQKTPGHTTPLPFGREDFEQWARSNPHQYSTCKRSWKEALRLVQVLLNNKTSSVEVSSRCAAHLRS